MLLFFCVKAVRNWKETDRPTDRATFVRQVHRERPRKQKRKKGFFFPHRKKRDTKQNRALIFFRSASRSTSAAPFFSQPGYINVGNRPRIESQFSKGLLAGKMPHLGHGGCSNCHSIQFPAPDPPGTFFWQSPPSISPALAPFFLAAAGPTLQSILIEKDWVQKLLGWLSSPPSAFSVKYLRGNILFLVFGKRHYISRVRRTKKPVRTTPA